MTDDTYFSTRLSPDPARAVVWAHVAAHLQRWVDERKPLLDLAAGYADFTAAVRALRRVAMDLNPMLPQLVSPGVEAEVGDCTDLSRFDDASFGTVFASNFIEHLEWPQIDRCASEVHRVLAPGGRWILVQPNFRLRPNGYFDDYTHRTIHSDRSLPDYLVSRGFAVDHVDARFLPLTMKSRLRGGARLVPLYLRLPYRPLAGQMLVVVSKPSVV